jgi:hypothetical protein
MFKQAYEIINNGDKYDQAKWLELYEKHKNSNEMLLVIFQNCGDNFPDSVYYETLNNIELNSKSSASHSTSLFPSLETEIINELLKRELSAASLYKLLDIRELSSVTKTFYSSTRKSNRSYSALDTALKVNPENTKKMARLAILNCEKKLDKKLELIATEEKQRKALGKEPLTITERTIKESDMILFLDSLSILSYIKDIDYLNKLIDEFETSSVSDLIATAIINNVFLDHEDPKVQELLNRAVENCDICMLETFPKCIASTISTIAYDTLIEFLDSNVSLTKWGLTEHPQTKMPVYPNNLKEIIKNLCEQETISEAVLTDLAHRIVEARIKYQDSFVVSVFSHISNPNLFPLVEQLLSHNKTDVYEKNPYLSDEIIIKRAEEFCKKINNYKQKGKERQIPDTWYEQIKAMAKKTTLSDMCYDVILDSFDVHKFVLEIAKYNTTPTVVLDKMIDFCKENSGNNKYYYLDRLMATIKFIKLHREDKIHKEVSKAFCNALDSTIFYLNENENMPASASTSYSLQGFRFLDNRIGEDTTTESINALKKCIKEDYFNPREKLFINRMFELLDDNRKQNKERKGDEAVFDSLTSIVRRYVDDHNIYTNIPKIIDDFDKRYESYLEKQKQMKLHSQIKDMESQRYGKWYL